MTLLETVNFNIRSGPTMTSFEMVPSHTPSNAPAPGGMSNAVWTSCWVSRSAFAFSAALRSRSAAVSATGCREMRFMTKGPDPWSICTHPAAWSPANLPCIEMRHSLQPPEPLKRDVIEKSPVSDMFPRRLEVTLPCFVGNVVCHIISLSRTESFMSMSSYKCTCSFEICPTHVPSNFPAPAGATRKAV